MNGIKCCLVGVVALVGTSARAETVAWYRFDECAPGTLTTADSRCLNAVDPTKCVGTFHVWNGNSSAYWNPPSVKTTPAEWMPTYDQGFGEYVGVRDPVSGLTQGNAASLRLAVSDPTVSMGVNLRAGLLMIEDDAILHSSSFTVEFFMKMPKCRITGGSYTIAQKGGVFSIGMSNDRWMTASVTTDSGSASITHRNYSGVDNDKWAHIALVANDETKKLTLYINGYGSSADYTGTVSDTAGKPMTFGGSPTSYVGVWDGRIAEVRVSNVALAPTQFLTFASHAPTSALTAPETLFFGDFNGGLDSVRFEDCYQNFAFSYRPSFLNRAASRADFPIASATLTWTSGQTATAETRELTGNVPAAAIRAGLVPTNGVEDAVALHFGTNAANPTASIPRLDINDPTRMIVSDSFTMEFFLKVGPGQICHDGSYTAYVVYQVNTLVLQMEENGCVAFSDGAGRKMYFPVAWNDSHDRTNLRYNDGAWHHYALVYDKDASRLDLYIDYARKGYLDDPKLCEDFTAQPQYRQLSFLGFYYNSDARRFRDATIDELRITRGALPVWRFLTTRAVEGTALGFASFDASLALTPYADLFPAPVATAATCDRARAGSLIHDGKDGALLRERNRGSVRIQGGQVVYPKNGLAGEAEEVTVEFFAKVGTAAAGAGLVRLNRASESETGAASWAISLANADGDLAVALDTDAATDVSHAFGGAIADGQWHHVAVTLAKDGADTRVTVYRDYVSLGSQVYAGRLLSRFHEANLMLGGGAEDGFDGWIDELRVTPGVLTADAFLTAESRGLSLILR